MKITEVRYEEGILSVLDTEDYQYEIRDIQDFMLYFEEWEILEIGVHTVSVIMQECDGDLSILFNETTRMSYLKSDFIDCVKRYFDRDPYAAELFLTKVQDDQVSPLLDICESITMATQRILSELKEPEPDYEAIQHTFNSIADLANKGFEKTEKQ